MGQGRVGWWTVAWTRRVALSAATLAALSATPSSGAAQTGTWQTQAGNPDRAPTIGKRVPLCPKLRLPANHASRKVLGADGAIYGSGLTGDRPTISKCVNGRVVWQRALNTVPNAIEGLWNAALYAGMTPGKNVALGVGEVDKNGQSKWFDKVDTPGDELDAIATTGSGKSGFAFYVLAGSTGKLPGQPGNAKGHRFVAAYAPHAKTQSKRAWIKQSKDFGRSPDPRGSGGKGAPAAIAADSRDGVYVVSGVDLEGGRPSSGAQAQVGTLTKLDAKGKPIFRRAVQVNTKALGVQSFRGTLQSVAVDYDGSSIFVAGEARVNHQSRLLVMRLDRSGTPVWANVTSVGYDEESKTDDGSTIYESGDLDAVRGLSVASRTLLVVAEYGNDYREIWDEEEAEMGFGGGSRDHNEVALVARFDSVRGKLQWARQYLGLGPEYQGASALRPRGIELGSTGRVTITGQEDIWVAQQSQRFEDVPALFELSDVKGEWFDDSDPTTAVELEFYEKLRAAVKRKDKKWLAAHTEFPLCCTYAGGEGTEVPDQATFLKRYDEIFNERVLESIDRTKTPGRGRMTDGLGTSDDTLQFDWVEARGPTRAGFYIIGIDNTKWGDDDTGAAPSAAAEPVAARGEPTETPKANEPTEQKPAEDTAPKSKREKIKGWFKEQHQKALEESKQEQEQKK